MGRPGDVEDTTERPSLALLGKLPGDVVDTIEHLQNDPDPSYEEVRWKWYRNHSAIRDTKPDLAAFPALDRDAKSQSKPASQSRRRKSQPEPEPGPAGQTSRDP